MIVRREARAEGCWCQSSPCVTLVGLLSLVSTLVCFVLAALWVWGDAFFLNGPTTLPAALGLSTYAVNCFLVAVAGCSPFNRELVLPWLVQTLVLAVSALTLGPLFIYKGLNYYPALGLVFGFYVKFDALTLAGSTLIAMGVFHGAAWFPVYGYFCKRAFVITH